jgi:hypothetical protein
MADPIRINGNAYDFGSVRMKLDGIRFEGVTSIKYSHKRERVKVTGLVKDRAPLGVTPGKYNAEDGSITMYTSTAAYLRQLIASKVDGLSYGDRIFTWTVQYVNPVFGSVITDELRGSWIIGDGASLEDNADPSKEEIPIGVSQIFRNGLLLSSRPF